MEKCGLAKSLRNSIVVIGFIFMLLIILDLLLNDTKVDYAMKASCIVDNQGILLLLSFIIFVYSLIFFYCKKRESNGYFKQFITFIIRHKKIVFSFIVILLFAFQVIVSWNIYFYTGWDTRKITSTALFIANGQPPVEIDYYSIYPNNIMLTSIFIIIFKIAKFLNFSDPYFALIFVDNILINLSGVLLILSVKKLVSNRKLIYLSGLIYVLLIGLSPWLVIPYSDTYGIIFPILTVFIYLHIKEEKHNLFLWFLLGMVSLLGYTIKPTIIIVLIAIILIELINLLSYNKEKLKYLFFKILMIFFAAILITCLSSYSKKIVNIPIEKERSFTHVHFLMMGLNEKTNGGYYGKDANFSKSISDKDEREKAEFEVIKNRLKKYGLAGYTEFISKKILSTYNDGTFAWGVEGAFYNVMLEPKNNTISPLLRNIYYHEGKYYSAFRFITQTIWILILVLYLGCIFSIKNERTLAMDVVLLSIIGIILFLLLFEARARYLYCYSPMFVLGAMNGLQSTITFFSKTKRNETN